MILAKIFIIDSQKIGLVKMGLALPGMFSGGAKASTRIVVCASERHTLYIYSYSFVVLSQPLEKTR